MSFTTGVQALQDAISQSEQRSSASKSFGAGKALGYFNWKPGDKKILRFLTDDFLVADFHNFIIDNTGQSKNFMVNPEDPHCLERYRSPSPGIGWHKDYRTGALVESTPIKMAACVAVERKEVPGPDGKMVYKDKEQDRTVDGTVLPGRIFGVVLQSITSFWHDLMSYHNRFGSICTCDYEITRLDTRPVRYSIIPLLPSPPELDTVEKVKALYFYGSPWDDNDPQRFLKCPQTVDQWAAYYGGEERYRYWLTPKDSVLQSSPAPAQAYAPSGMDEYAKETTSNADEAQAVQPSRTDFASLQNTLLASQKKQK